MPKKKCNAHNLAALDLRTNPGVAFFIAACAMSYEKPYQFCVGDRALTSTEFAYYLLFSQAQGFRFDRLFTMSSRHWLMRFTGAITDVLREVRRSHAVR